MKRLQGNVGCCWVEQAFVVLALFRFLSFSVNVLYVVVFHSENNRKICGAVTGTHALKVKSLRYFSHALCKKIL